MNRIINLDYETITIVLSLRCYTNSQTNSFFVTHIEIVFVIKNKINQSFIDKSYFKHLFTPIACYCKITKT